MSRAEVRAPDAAVAHERGDDPPGVGVDRDDQAEADTGDGGVHADDVEAQLATDGARSRATVVMTVE